MSTSTLFCIQSLIMAFWAETFRLLLYNKYALDGNLIDQSVISVWLDIWLASQHRVSWLKQSSTLYARFLYTKMFNNGMLPYSMYTPAYKRRLALCVVILKLPINNCLLSCGLTANQVSAQLLTRRAAAGTNNKLYCGSLPQLPLI
jgi:hypothetical protein